MFNRIRTPGLGYVDSSGRECSWYELPFVAANWLPGLPGSGLECPGGGSDESVAVSTPPYSGVTVGGRNFPRCRGINFNTMYGCASWADGQGLVDAKGAPWLVCVPGTRTVTGDCRMLTPGGGELTTTGRTGPETRLDRPRSRPPFPVAEVMIGVGVAVAVGLVGYGVWKRRTR